MQHSYVYLAQVYGDGSYGSSAYSSSTTTGTGTTTPAATGGSLLTNTGFDVALSATLACVIIFSAVVVRFWKRPTKATNTQQNS